MLEPLSLQSPLCLPSSSQLFHQWCPWYVSRWELSLTVISQTFNSTLLQQDMASMVPRRIDLCVCPPTSQSL